MRCMLLRTPEEALGNPNEQISANCIKAIHLRIF
jgi:hypothetical protein